MRVQRGRHGSLVRAPDRRPEMRPGFESCWRHFGTLAIPFVNHTLSLSFGVDTKSRWSLLFSVYASGSKNVHYIIGPFLFREKPHLSSSWVFMFFFQGWGWLHNCVILFTIFLSCSLSNVFHLRPIGFSLDTVVNPPQSQSSPFPPSLNANMRSLVGGLRPCIHIFRPLHNRFFTNLE